MYTERSSIRAIIKTSNLQDNYKGRATLWALRKVDQSYGNYNSWQDDNGYDGRSALRRL